MDGKMYKPHLFFSKLKKPPKVNKGPVVVVNNTGIWSMEVLVKYVDNILLKRPETSLLKEPVLLIMDSYGPHITLMQSKKYEKRNIFIDLGTAKHEVLQPLDVAVNKIFQDSFGRSYDTYIADTL
jgi:hypothetical protein